MVEISKTGLIWALSILLLVLISGFMLKEYTELLVEKTTIQAINDYNEAVLQEFKDYGFLKLKYPINETKTITIELSPITQEEVNLCLYYQGIVEQLSEASS